MLTSVKPPSNEEEDKTSLPMIRDILCDIYTRDHKWMLRKLPVDEDDNIIDVTDSSQENTASEKNSATKATLNERTFQQSCTIKQKLFDTITDMDIESASLSNMFIAIYDTISITNGIAALFKREFIF